MRRRELAAALSILVALLAGASNAWAGDEDAGALASDPAPQTTLDGAPSPSRSDATSVADAEPSPRTEDDPSSDVKTDVAPRSSAPFQQLRYLEDYSHLSPSAATTNPFEAVKHVPLWGDAYLSFGGQHRLRYEYTAPAVYGASLSAARESVLLSRNLLHIDAHLHPRLRVFGQVGAFYALGAPARDVPPGTNQVDVTQLFVESNIDVKNVRVTARVGRQETSLGSTRWVSVRDATNQRQAFDLARVSLAGRSWKSDTFFGFVPKVLRGVFDDAPNPKNVFWGSYWTFPLVPDGALSLDAFYLGRGRAVTYREISGLEVRHTIGVRAFGKFSGGFEYIAHGIVQLGKVGDADVLAWGTAGGVWQRLPGKLGFARVGLRGDALSGDAKAGDGKVTTFDPLFPNQSFFSALTSIFPSNLYDVHPLVQLEYESVRLEAGWIFFWRQAVEDAVYAPVGRPIVPPTASQNRTTASQASLSFGYRATRNLSFDAELAHLFAAGAYAEGGGRDVDFFGTWTTFTY